MKPIVVITGASSGIGAATARRFGKENVKLVLLARRGDRLKQLQKEIAAPSLTYEVDVTDSDLVANTIAHIEEKEGPIEILVNNAGGAFGLDLAHKAHLNDWDACVDVNIKGLLYCTHAVLPHLVERNKGHIVNIGSIAGTYSYPGGNVYGACKAFVHQFSLNLKADLLGTKVRVTCIEPGLLGATEFSTVRFKGDEKRAKAVYENTRPLLPEDVAETIFFCTSVPPHVNINVLEVMPVAQASSSLSVHREG
jgi:3-hydroxy acid dehydrogenase/malonic semialdehyde reductase